MSLSHVNRVSEEKTTQNQLPRSIPVLMYFLVTGQMEIEGKHSLNKVWARQNVSDGNQKFRAHQSHLHTHNTGTNQTLIND